MPLIKQFYSDRYLQIRSFGLSLAIAVLLCSMAYSIHSPEFYASFHYAHWMWLLVPIGIYVGGVSAVWMHNACHGSFKNPVLNRLCGEIAGIHQLWGFTGWKLIHLLHHMYSDKADHDTHPPKGFTFWQFTTQMFVYSSACITKRYREHYGDNAQTQFLQRAGLGVFLAMAAANLVFWYLLLGPALFVFFFVPSYITNHLLYAHINYRAHPADPLTGETAPVNLNHNLYYKLANLCWFGIYFHGNHHRKPLLFNPRYMPARRERAAA